MPKINSEVCTTFFTCVWFKGGDGNFMSVDGHCAKWKKEIKSGVIVFTKNTLKMIIKYLLQSYYFKAWNTIFR